jgi:ribosomal protein uS7
LDLVRLYFGGQVNDISLADYVGVQVKHATYVPHTAGRYSVKRFRKAQCPIVERLTNSLQMHGRNNGKKLKAVTIVKHAMEIIHLLTDQNPIQVIVDAVVNRSVIKFIVLFLIDWSLLVISGRLVFTVFLS